MKRMFIYVTIGQAIGFGALTVLFLSLSEGAVAERRFFIVLAFTSAMPIAIIAALFSVLSTIQEELRETRRELKHWQSMQLYLEAEKPSTNIKPAPPSRSL
jgi:hypothetical protein